MSWTFPASKKLVSWMSKEQLRRDFLEREEASSLADRLLLGQREALHGERERISLFASPHGP